MASFDFFSETKSLLTLNQLSNDDLHFIIERAWQLKFFRNERIPQHAKGKTLVLYMEKRSTRTRLSCTVAWTKLGGNVIDLSPSSSLVHSSHIGEHENLYDSFRVISDMADCIVARVNNHETLGIIEKASADSRKKPPVINGLSDLWHPLQILADVLTMYERILAPMVSSHSEPRFDVRALNGQKFTWVGDANNVANSLITTLPRFGVNVTVCTPEEYVINDAIYHVVEMDGNLSLLTTSHNPEEAIKDADFICTDTWVSMGNEEEKEKRLAAFSGFQINKELIESGKPKENHCFLHCLPRKKEEVSDDIFYGPNSLVFGEAENRMWSVLAVFSEILSSSWP